jgi:hypothetical protein
MSPSRAAAHDPSVAEDRATSPDDWGGKRVNSRRKDSRCRRVVLLLVLLAFVACSGPVANAQTCQGTAADLQALRDNLEIIRVQVKAARNETGTDKNAPTDAIATVLRTLEAAAGHPIEPSPAAKIAVTPPGSKHPHAQVIHQAFPAAERAFDRVRCALPGPVEPLAKAMADLDQALQFR